MMPESGNQQTKRVVVKTVCNMCDLRCGIDVYVESGRIIEVHGMAEHPRHTLCPKGYAIPELVHSRDRLTNPLKKVGGGFAEISWNEAFDFVANKLSDIKGKSGPQALNVHVGNAFIATHTEKVVRRFCDLYGTPNYSTGGSFCFLARAIGHILTCGALLLPHYSSDTKCIIIWGNNPPETSPLQAEEISAAASRGAKLVVVDPRVTELAKKADIHLQIRPGTDCALALGLLNVIISEGLYDRGFVEEWTAGFDELVEHVKQYSPERIEEITWVKAEIIRRVARLYAFCKPASVFLGISMDHCTNGIQAIRAISTLIAVTGNIDVSGGNVYTPSLWQTSLRVKDKAPDVKTSISAHYPLYSEFSLESTASVIPDCILSEKPYPIKALLIAGANPILTWPNTNKVKQSFKKLDLLVVIDIFMTETAKMADLVLPGTTFLERQDLRHYRATALALVVATNKVIEPVGNSMEDWKIWAELGRRMGYSEYFPWRDSDELFEYLLNPSKITLEELRKQPGGIRYASREFRKYLKSGFNTTSKKVEIFSQAMADLGYDPIPTFEEPAESPISRPDIAKDYPLIMITGPRTIAFLHSEFRNLASLREIAPEPFLEINYITARDLGIEDGELVNVESLRGSIEMKAKLTEDILPKVVSIQHGWSEANANLLTDDENRDPISGYPGFRSILCRVFNREKKARITN